MISGTQLCILNIKDTAFFQKLSQQAVIYPIASTPPPKHLTPILSTYTDGNPNLDVPM